LKYLLRSKCVDPWRARSRGDPGTPASLPHEVITRDYHNERQILQKKKLKKRLSIQALLNSLNTYDEFYSDYQITYNDGSGAFTYFFILHYKHCKLLAQNPKILIIDLTYKTNRYGMPLVNTVGITPFNRSFYAANVFITSETENDFIFIFETLKRMYE
jgi:hypothetical protein